MALCMGLNVAATEAADEGYWLELTAKIEILHEDGDFAEVVEVAREALKVANEVYGPDHANVATSLYWLATAYLFENQLKDARLLYRRTIGLYEQIYGPDNAILINPLDGLATVHRNQGNVDKAMEYHERALRLAETGIGSDSPELVPLLVNMYKTCHQFGNTERAAELEARVKKLAPEALSNVNVERSPEQEAELMAGRVAELYASGNIPEAIRQGEEALQYTLQKFGNGSAIVATAMNNLAAIFHKAGKNDKAETLFLEALKIREAVYGEADVSTVLSISNLAKFYKMLEKYDRAERYYERAFGLMRKMLNPGDPLLVDAKRSLDDVRRVISEREALLNEIVADAPRTSALPEAFAARREAQRAAKATSAADVAPEPVLVPVAMEPVKAEKKVRKDDYEADYFDAYSSGPRRVNNRKRRDTQTHNYYMAGPEDRPIPEHVLEYLTQWSNAGREHVEQGNFAEAEHLFTREAEVREEVLGTNHPLLAMTYAKLSALYYVQGKDKEGHRTYRKAARIRRKSFSDKDLNAAIFMNKIGDLDQVFKEIKDPLARYHRTVLFFKDLYGSEHSYTKAMYENLDGLYQSMEEAARNKRVTRQPRVESRSSDGNSTLYNFLKRKISSI